MAPRGSYRQRAHSPFREASEGWSELPVDLMHLIMRKVEADIGIAGIVKLRGLSKSWMSAFQQYPAAEATEGIPANHLGDVCNMLPCMKSLRVHLPSQTEAVDFKALRLCSELSSIIINGEESTYQLSPAELHYLLGQVHSISFMNVKLPPSKQQNNEWSKLTKLALWHIDSKEEDVVRLLQCLPNLKFLLTAKLGILEYERPCWERMAALTGLNCYNEHLTVPVERQQWPTSLQRLTLDVHTSIALLNPFLQGVQLLTSLALHYRPLDEVADTEKLHLPTSLRKLELFVLGPSRLHKPYPLESLSCPIDHGETEQNDVQCIAALTSLTSLKLVDLQPWAHLEPLKGLPRLQELDLGKCSHLAVELLTPEALPSLRSLKCDPGGPDLGFLERLRGWRMHEEMQNQGVDRQGPVCIYSRP